jgi:hypothetical protein
MLQLLTPRAVASGLAGAVLFAACVAPAAGAAAPNPSAKRSAVLERLELVELAAGVRLEIDVDRGLGFTLGRDAEGRLTIDLPGARPGLGIVSRVVPGGLVAEIRLVSVGVPSRPVTRVVVATRAPADHRVDAAGGRLRLELVPAGADFPAAPAPPRPRLPAPQSAPPAPPRATAPWPAPRGVSPLPSAPAAPPVAVATDAALAPLAIVEPESPPAIEATDLDVDPAFAPRAAPAEESGPTPPAPPLVERPVAPLTEAPPEAPAALALPPSAALVVDEPDPAAHPPAGAELGATRASPPPAPAPPLREVATELRSIARLAPGVLAVAGDGRFDYTGFRLERPERFVLDLHGVRNLVAEGVLPIEEGVVTRVRVTQYRLAPAPVTRVIFDLRAPTLPAIEPAADGLLVRFPATRADSGARPDPAPFR